MVSGGFIVYPDGTKIPTQLPDGTVLDDGGGSIQPSGPPTPEAQQQNIRNHLQTLYNTGVAVWDTEGMDLPASLGGGHLSFEEIKSILGGGPMLTSTGGVFNPVGYNNGPGQAPGANTYTGNPNPPLPGTTGPGANPGYFGVGGMGYGMPNMPPVPGVPGTIGGGQSTIGGPGGYQPPTTDPSAVTAPPSAGGQPPISPANPPQTAHPPGGGPPPFSLPPGSITAPPPAAPPPTPGGSTPNSPPVAPPKAPPGAPGSEGYPSGGSPPGTIGAPAYAPDAAWDAGVNALEEQYGRLWDKGKRSTLENMASRGTINSSIEAGAYGELDADLRSQQAQGLATLARQRSDDSFRERTLQQNESQFGRQFAEQVASRLQQESQFARGLQSEEMRDMLGREIQREALELQRQGMSFDQAYKTAAMNSENFFRTRTLELQQQGQDAETAYRTAELEWRKQFGDKELAVRQQESNNSQLMQMYQLLAQFAPWLIDPKTGKPKTNATGSSTGSQNPAYTQAEWDAKYDDYHNQGFDDNYIKNYLGPRPSA